VSIFVIIYFLFIIWTFFFIFLFFFKYRDRNYIKVVESIQFVCAGNSGISWVLCNANTYRSIHEGLFFNSSPALDLKIPLETNPRHLGTWTTRYLDISVLTWTSRYSVLDISVLTWTSRYSVLDSSGLGVGWDNIRYWPQLFGTY
jgi:hypothetical protein